MNERPTPDSPAAMGFDYDAVDPQVREELRGQTAAIRSLKRKVAQDIVEIGKRLIDVKAKLDHGLFGRWLATEFGWSHDVANRWMAIAREFGDFPQLAEIAPSALAELARPSTPEVARQEARARIVQGERLRHSDTRAIIARYKPGAERPTQQSSTRVTVVPIRGDVVLERSWNEMILPPEEAEAKRRARQQADRRADVRDGIREAARSLQDFERQIKQLTDNHSAFGVGDAIEDDEETIRIWQELTARFLRLSSLMHAIDPVRRRLNGERLLDRTASPEGRKPADGVAPTGPV